MENMEYYTQRLQCSDEEKDACLETVKKLCRIQYNLRQDGTSAVRVLAEEEADPFFRVCLLEFAELYEDPDGLERLLTRYLMAGDYRGGAFLNAVLISQGLVLWARYDSMDYEDKIKLPWFNWVDGLGGSLRCYFGAEYWKKVTKVIRREQNAKEAPENSLLPEFDRLTELSPQRRDWLVRHISINTLCHALKYGGSAVREFLMDGAEDRDSLEQDLYYTSFVREKDAEKAQKEILEKAADLVQSDAGTV